MYDSDDVHDLTPELMQSIFSTGMPLSSLKLGDDVDQRVFDVLLTAGTQLTQLKCLGLYLTEDRSQAACSLQEIVGFAESGTPLAYLPLHSLTRLHFDNLQLPSERPCLEYSVDGSADDSDAPEAMSDEDSTPATLLQVLANLRRCPAWQQSGPDVEIRLDCSQHASRQDLLSSLAALSALANKKVQLRISGLGYHHVAVGEQEVQGMGRALGPALTQLHLSGCHITPAFWPAVWAHLPGLQQLTVGQTSYQSSYLITEADIASFCSLATRPLQLVLGRRLYDRLGGSETLERQCQVGGIPKVTVIVADD
jgi:hypothetical protein